MAKKWLANFFALPRRSLYVVEMHFDMPPDCRGCVMKNRYR